MSNAQLKSDATYLARSIMLVLIAIAINIVLPIVYLLLNNRIYILLGPNSLHLAIFIYEGIKLIASCLVLVGVGRIVYLLKAEVPIFYSLAAIITFAFFCALKGSDLWHYILITSGRSFGESELRPVGLLILPPLGIVSCCAIALRGNLHFRLFQDKGERIYILSILIGLIWVLGIILSSILWWQNRQTIEFELRWLVIRNYRWQMQSRFYCFYATLYSILPLLWQIWLYISLNSARNRLRLFHEGVALPKDEQKE